jgi:hypothetical protein
MLSPHTPFTLRILSDTCVDELARQVRGGGDVISGNDGYEMFGPADVEPVWEMCVRHMSRDEAEVALAGKSIGTFLLRAAETPDVVKLSVVETKVVRTVQCTQHFAWATVCCKDYSSACCSVRTAFLPWSAAESSVGSLTLV